MSAVRQKAIGEEAEGNYQDAAGCRDVERRWRRNGRRGHLACDRATGEGRLSEVGGMWRATQALGHGSAGTSDYGGELTIS